MNPREWNRTHKNIDADPPFIEAGDLIKPGAVLPLEVLPKPFWSFAGQVNSELFDYGTRTVRVLRWRRGSPGSHGVVKYSRGMKWSFDGREWKVMPHTLRLHLSAGWVVSKVLSDDVVKDTLQLVADGENEPLAHELYREASALKASGPRSALVIGVAAAETAMKQLIGTLVPGARWLVENLSSPPLEVMLRDYLPTLPAKQQINGKVLAPPKELLETLQKAVAIRNRIVHGRQATFNIDTLDEILAAVHDLLYLVDLYCGFRWAMDRVSQKTKTGLARADTT
jgi:hypothetical protein